jgi:hypothetical protein
LDKGLRTADIAMPGDAVVGLCSMGNAVLEEFAR